MGITRRLLNPVLAAILVISLPDQSARADPARAAELLQELRKPDLPNWQNVANAIQAEWSKSGSAAMDLLLKRGRDAVEAGDFETAIAHFTALTDHAPEFAEGFNARALAYFKTGLYGPALADLSRALVLTPDHFGALTGLATILEETGQEARALAAYRAARAIHPHDPDLETAVNRLAPKLAGQPL